MWFTVTLVTLLAVTSFKETNGYFVDTNTRYIEALPGTTITYVCKIPAALLYCRMEIPGFPEAVLLAPNRPTPGGRTQYEGAGLDKGVCGVKLTNVEERHNGQFKCTLGSTDYTESSQNMTLIVARAPSPPELKFLPPVQSSETFKEGDIVSLKCTSYKGRPIANLTWYIGNDLIVDGLSAPLKTREENDFYTISQNLTRTLHSSDSGKDIKCVAGHMALTSPINEKKHYLKVQYAPKAWDRAHEQLGLVEGQEGRVVVHVQGNPKPTFVWRIGEDSIFEGGSDNENKYEVLRTQSKGGDIYETTLKIHNLSKEDIKKSYALRATNVRGEREYEIYISTNTEPRSTVGAKTIIFLFIAIIIVSIIALAVFARAKGLWCFAGRHGAAGTGSEAQFDPTDQVNNKGTDNPSVNHHASTELINDNALLTGIRQLESSDTESMSHRPGDDKGKKDNKPKISVKAIFKKKLDQKLSEGNKPSSNGSSAGAGDADPEAGKVSETSKVTLVSEKEEPKETEKQKKGNDNVVYAELTLPAASSSPVAQRPRVVEDKTEYAEIIHS